MPVSALFLDLDRLKAINDYLGHHAGDWFIRTFAERLREETAEADLIARLGGDEFVVVPAGPTTAEAAEALAYRLQAVLRERVPIGGEMLTRTVSIGVALGVPGRDTTSDLLRRADQAVLNAKNAGGNKIAVFTEEMSLKSELRNDIELHLQSVIETGSLILHYLPEFDMRTGEVLATEALVRWQHPTRGLLLPDSFIHVAESINLAGELGRWVMRAACEQFSQWHAQGIGENAILRINVSPVQLVTDGFVESVADAIADFGLEGKSVCLEITESVVVQDIETTRVTLAGLKQVGVQVAIDDFGTGYSVLTHLKSLPVDTLKIDKSFVTRPRLQPRRPRHRACHRRAGRGVRPRVGRRGGGVARGGGDPAAARVPPRSGIPALASAACRGDGRAVREKGCPGGLFGLQQRLRSVLDEQFDPAEPAAGPAHESDLRDGVAQFGLHRPCRAVRHRARGQGHSRPRAYQSGSRCGVDGGAGHPSPFEDQPLQTQAVPGDIPLPRLLGQPVGQCRTRTVDVGPIGAEHGSPDGLT